MITIYNNIKIYNLYYCIDSNNDFPCYLNIHSFYPLLKNTSNYSDLKVDIEIDKGFCLFNLYENNYQHWLLELVPKLLDYNQQIPLIVTENIIQPFKDYLHDLDYKNIIYISNTKIYLIKEIYTSNNININFYNKGLLHTDIYTQIYNMYKDINLGYKKVFISRRDTKIRNLLNIDEVEMLFRSRDYTIIELSNLSFGEKVGLFINTPLIIGFIGAGMINSIFSRNGNIIKIILHPKFRCIYYWNILNRQFGLNIKLLDNICKINENINIDNVDYIANIDLLANTI
jgi:capsular polysaccharide biosynthesis protein